MRPMPELQIHEMPVDELVPYANNAKKHPQKQVDEIANSIAEFGNCDPIGIWHNEQGQAEIVEGHGRVLALKKLGIETAPVIILDHLTDEQRRAYTHVHNQTTLSSGFDYDALVADMDNLNVDWDSFGFEKYLPEYDEDGTLKVENDVYEDEAPSRVKRGQLWQLGEHLLLCGSSTDKADVARLMGDDHAELLFTSPPYADMRTYNGGKNLSVEDLAEFIPTFAPYCSYMAVNLGIKIRDSEIVPYWNAYIDAAHSIGLKLMAWNVWDKGMCGSVGQQMAFVPIRHEFVFMFAQHDFTFVFGSKDKPLNKTWKKKPESIGDIRPKTRRNEDGTMRRQSHGNGDGSNPYKEMESVLSIYPETGKIREKHPAVFPVKLPQEYIAAMTRHGDIVAEPFGGSGTTLVACENIGRRCRVMELDESYCDVIVQRWEDLTGGEAVLVD